MKCLLSYFTSQILKLCYYRLICGVLCGSFGTDYYVEVICMFICMHLVIWKASWIT